jgi:cytochrome c oxidase subunit IV
MSVHAMPHAPEEHAHPGPRQYIIIAVILSVITAVEVAIYYIPSLRPIIAPILILLSAVKFSVVVMYYMHLKFDSKLFTTMFIFGLAMAAFTIIMFIGLFHGLVPMGAPSTAAPH